MTRYFEDFVVGASAESAGRTITEADIVAFAALSGDYTQLHTDQEYAARSPFGRRVAHGALIFSISTGLAVQMSPRNEALLALFGIDGLRFVRPVFIGDTVRVRKRVAETEQKDPRRGLVTFETAVVNQHEQTVVLYHDKVLLQRKPK